MTDAEYLTEPGLAGLPGLAHGFFTRRGGVSEGPWAALNCSLSGQDDIEKVRENRRRAMAAFGLDRAALHGLKQVHGPEVAVVEQGWTEGQGPAADAMVTRRPGVALGIVTADCAPVLFAEPEAGVIGAAHAGWRGAVGGVLEATVAAMEALGAARHRIRAAIGPCIGQKSYEVGPDLREAVLAREAGDARFFVPGRREERWQFDLAGYCAARLAALGLAAASALQVDTLAEEARFFSHRRRTLAGGGPIGHQLSAIAVTG
ncbi:peptidoglycan editing factor PgeF [Siccirubricoccus sp. KC 17139]|uniref:Purine nucleoside phosphorylase n=1 Tax=Siccirubricoccus soli TaxID=2899147 RepID=A0ABT1DA61_9PROT|nr:peptidoglycan editing factor PgeF [Siccirubricoccus soli]MCO6418822.1 peptidoglycan editing factor PgeF [Siccirubricoccus soli]MCP2684957.1 peptidoglycan editing factor PgeF [Siccirubricoccus soli]